MRPWETGPVHDLIADAMRNSDTPTIMRLITEQIETTEGAEKAYWLAYRATAKELYGQQPGNRATRDADYAEARRVNPDDVSVWVNSLAYPVLTEQRLGDLAQIPSHMRRAIRRELQGSWRYWGQVAFLHRLRRRFYQAYRAYTRMLSLYLNISPEERRNNGGWAILLYSWHARSAIRMGRLDEAAADVAAAVEIDAGKVRKYLNPLPLAFAKAELALTDGRYRTAIAELQFGRNRVAELQLPSSPWHKIESDLIAARVARADGNLIAFEHFCDRALSLARDNNLPLSEVEVWAVLNGAPW